MAVSEAIKPKPKNQLIKGKTMKRRVKATLVFSLLFSSGAFANCIGYSGPGGPCSTGPGGGLSTGPGGGLSTGPGNN
jgi:hypothetical protein